MGLSERALDRFMAPTFFVALSFRPSMAVEAR